MSGAGISALGPTVGLGALPDPMGEATALLEARRRQQIEGAGYDPEKGLYDRYSEMLGTVFGPTINERAVAAREAMRRGDMATANALNQSLALDFGQFLGSIKPIRAYHGSPHDIEVTQPYPQSYDAFVGGQKAGNMSVSSSGPFASPTVVEPDFRRKGVATALYDQAERDMGRRMIPSPLGLSDDAVQFWRSRFAAMPDHEAAALIREAQAVGESMGIGKHSSERLAKAFPSYADAIRKYGIAGLIGAATGAGLGSLYLDGDEGGM